MADVTPQSPSVTGLALTAQAAADPMTITNNGRVYLIALNSSGAERTFEIVSTKTEEGGLLAVADLPITIGASETQVGLGTYATALYNDGANEITLQNFNDTSGLSFLVIQT